MMATKLSVDDLLDQIGSLTLLEAADLKKKMEEKFGVTAAAPVAFAAAPGAAGGGAAAAEEKTEFDVILTSVGEKKIEVLKVVREVTGLGLKEAKDVVDSAPKPLKEKVKKEEADQIKQKIEATGAKVEIK
jgi:large subunit ribosomal protein L7/L12